MTDWTAGYVADIGYTYGYYIELNPLRMRLAFLNAGLAIPEVGTACELGFGQGVSANFHASASVTHWIGTDFNPSQAGFAQQLASVSGSDAQLFDESFTEFCVRPDLPDFDYIGLHGIWSWISDENRAVIVDFIRRKLKVGGVLYISYNTQPGWAEMVPMRDLLTEHSEVMGIQGQGLVPRIDNALAFAEKLLATNPAYARANPHVAERLRKLKEHDRSYLAHEYFNRDWLPMPFSRMAEWLAPTKLNYACSAHYLDHINTLIFSAEQQALLKEIPDAMFRETVRDFCINQQFRRDYWVKGARKLNMVAQTEALRAQRVILVEPRAGVSLKINCPLGEATMQEVMYVPILDALADHQVQSLGDIEQMLKGRGINFAQILQAVMVLTGTGALLAAQEASVIDQVKTRTDKLNAYLCDQARGSGEINFLASPVTGGGITVPRFPQLFLLAKSQGKTQPAEWAAFAWNILAMHGERIIKDGKELESAADNLAELTAQAETFSVQSLPILRALGIA